MVVTNGPWAAGKTMASTRTAIEIVLRLAPQAYYANIRYQLTAAGIVRAVAEHDTPVIYDWVVGLLDLQGISDRAATAYQRSHPPATFETIKALLQVRPRCDRLRAWWLFQCGYRKGAHSCALPFNLASCLVPKLDRRKGTLAEAALGFFLFIRDVADGDLVAWIDERLASHDPGRGHPQRAQRMRAAVLEPLTEIRGTGPKIWSMILADLLLAADPGRERWVTTGASMIAIDSLVHNFLDRTGTLRRAGAEHPYGPSCYRARGCASVIADYATTIDARQYDPELPRHCPRFVQHAIWHFCAEGGRGICNAHQIDDRERCQQVFCPAFATCERLPRRTKAEDRKWRL